MARVGVTGELLLDPNPSAHGRKRKKSVQPNQPFSELFKKKEAELLEEAKLSLTVDDNETVSLQQLADDVLLAGNELKHVQSRSALKKYRETIKRFLSQFVSENYSVENKMTRRFQNGFLQEKSHYVIHELDKKLEETVQAFLHSQERPLELLKKIDEINGLVINILR